MPPTLQRVPCDQCSKLFERVVGQRGRPRIYCSETCKVTAAESKRATR